MAINIKRKNIIYRYVKIGEEYLCKVLIPDANKTGIRICKTTIPITKASYQNALASIS